MLLFTALLFSFDITAVERDFVPKDPKSPSKWESKEQIMREVKSLGDGISVFFLYAPCPDDLYRSPDAQEGKPQLRNRFLMSRLFFDLELHGFHVVSDLHLRDNPPSNWLLWYITRISQCNYVILVCTPAFKTLFEKNPDCEKILDPKAKRMLEYRNAVYAALCDSSKRMKFIPVVLDHAYSDERNSVPSLFQAGKIYHIYKEDKRKFDFDNFERDFEQLVCHMAGIDRMELLRNKQQVSCVPTLPGPFANPPGE